MITENYCSFELSKLLKEKGFDGGCIGCYWDSKKTFDINYEPLSYSDGDLRDEVILAPTHQMAMKWLREEHDWYISIGYYEDGSTDADGNIVETWWFWGYDIIGLPSGGIAVECCDEYYSYEEAVEAALKYTLENLI